MNNIENTFKELMTNTKELRLYRFTSFPCSCTPPCSPMSSLVEWSPRRFSTLKLFSMGQKVIPHYILVLEERIQKCSIEWWRIERNFNIQAYDIPLAFHIWAYNSIPSLSKKICRNENSMIISWTNNDSRVTAALLEKYFTKLNEIILILIDMFF